MSEPLKHLDLFSGIGGFALGLEWAGGFETVGFCEIDPFCQKLLAKNFPGITIYDDVRTLDHAGPVDIITGGYPCQPFSLAGKRKGKGDDRHLWPAMFDLIKKHRPAWVIGENVAGHINMGLDDVLADLESEGYAVQTFIIPAVAVDAKHRRDRIWIVANNDGFHGGTSGKCETQKGSANEAIPTGEQSEPLANALRQQDIRDHKGGFQYVSTGSGEIIPDPTIPGLPNGRGSQASTNPNSINVQGQQSGGVDPQKRTGQNQRPSGSQAASIGRVWPVEPGICMLSYGLSKKLDGDRINAKAKKKRPDKILCNMQDPIETEEDKYPSGRPGGIHKTEILQSGLYGHGSDETEPNTFIYSKTIDTTQEGILRELRSYRDSCNSSQRSKLAKQQPFKFTDALQFVSYVLASHGGGHHQNQGQTPLHCLWQAIVSIGAMQHTSDPSEEIWQSMSCADQDWSIMAACFGCFWAEFPGVARVKKAIPRRVDRLKGLGNAVLPQIPEIIGIAIIKSIRTAA